MLSVIPNMEEPLRYTEIQKSCSPFRLLVDGVDFDVKMQYPIMQMVHAEEQCFLRREAFERLVEAQKLLPRGIRFRIWDAWRPLKLQEELYDKYSMDIIKRFRLETKSEEERKKVLAGFVSEPEKDPFCGPVHTTGGAVDLTLIDAEGRELDMGTAFDDFSEKAYTGYFENTDNEEVKYNRRLLFDVMTRAGFTNLPSEWWHYDFGDRFWAYYNQKPAIYEGVFTKEEVKLA